MIEKIRFWIKYRKVDLLIIFSFVIMAFVINYVSGAILKVVQLEKAKEKNVYTDMFACRYQIREDDKIGGFSKYRPFSLEELSRAISPEPERLIIEAYMRVGEALESYDVHVEMTDYMEHETVAQTSSYMLEKVGYKENGVWYIKVGKIPLEVSINEEEEESVRIYYQDMSREDKTLIQEMVWDVIKHNTGIDVAVAGEEPDDVWHRQLSQYAKSHGYEDVSFSEYEEKKGDKDFMAEYNLKIIRVVGIFMYIFAVFNSMMISVLWLEHRKKELLIRRAYGYTRGQIVEYVFKAYRNFAAIAAGIVGVLQIVVSLFRGEFSLWVLERLLFLAVGLVGTILCFVMVQVGFTNKMKIITGLQRYNK